MLINQLLLKIVLVLTIITITNALNNNNIKYKPISIKNNNYNNIKSIINKSIIISSSFITLINVNKANSIDKQLLECSDSISQLKSTNGKEIILIGTAHISEDSANQVRRIINQTKPNIVMIELDMNRIGKIANIETLKENGFDIPSFDKQTIAQTPIKTNNNQILSIISDFSNTISNWISRGAGQLLGKSLGQFYSSVEKLGFKAGGEFKAAYEEAKNVNARILLGDRNVNITLQRLAAAIATTNPTKFETLAYKLFELEKDAGIDISSEEDLINNKDVLSKFVENLKQRKLLNQVMTLVKSELPDVYNALIGERDIYMAKSIIESNATKLVAVVGMAHMTGIENYLINNSNYKLNNNNNKC